MKTAKGHAFRRVAGGRVKKPALAAEEFNPQGLKALSYFGPLSARMNPCPFACPQVEKSSFHTDSEAPALLGVYCIYLEGGHDRGG